MIQGLSLLPVAKALQTVCLFYMLILQRLKCVFYVRGHDTRRWARIQQAFRSGGDLPWFQLYGFGWSWPLGLEPHRLCYLVLFFT